MTLLTVLVNSFMKKQKAGCGPHCEQTVAVMRQIRWITKSKRRRVSEWIGGKFGGLYPPSRGFFFMLKTRQARGASAVRSTGDSRGDFPLTGK